MSGRLCLYEWCQRVVPRLRRGMMHQANVTKPPCHFHCMPISLLHCLYSPSGVPFLHATTPSANPGIPSERVA